MIDVMSREIRLASRPNGIPTAFGWREYFMASPKELHLVNREVQPLSVYLGALGMTGMTA
jgi:NADPH-dependent curcumin reductase CurA